MYRGQGTRDVFPPVTVCTKCGTQQLAGGTTYLLACQAADTVLYYQDRVVDVTAACLPIYCKRQRSLCRDDAWLF